MDYQNTWKKTENTNFCDEIVKEINILRKNPKVYLELLEKYIKGFEDDCIFFGDSNIGTLLEEGKSVVSKINFISEFRNSLLMHKNISKIIKDY